MTGGTGWGAVELEAVTRVAPLGIRPWDVAAGTPAGAGLVVRHRPFRSSRVVTAVHTPSGIYALRGLPGLGAAERGSGDGAYWDDPPATGTYRIEVDDPEGRFLPVAFDADLPVRGVFAPACGFTGTPPWSPDPSLPQALVVPLFSAPARLVPAGLAVVRAELELARRPSSPGDPPRRGGGPASWALLQVTVPDGPTALGAADGAGRATVVFPYPEPPGLDASAPGPGTTALTEQTWTLGLRAYFGPGPGSAPVTGPDGVPDLCELLGQRAAEVFSDESATPLTSVQLRYGRQLVVRTAGNSTLLLAPSSQGVRHA
jgi:hypothetical protein